MKNQFLLFALHLCALWTSSATASVVLDSTILSLSAHGPANAITGSWSAPQFPIPAAVWLFGSGLLVLIAMARRKKAG